jgi:hypothetical protein
MATPIPPKSFMVACKEFFGFLPNQTLLQFREEIAALTPTDRKEIAEGLSKLPEYPQGVTP